jgi:hypothetical protein
MWCASITLIRVSSSFTEWTTIGYSIADFEWLKKDIPVSFEDNFLIDNQDQKLFGDFFFKTAHGRYVSLTCCCFFLVKTCL